MLATDKPRNAAASSRSPRSLLTSATTWSTIMSSHESARPWTAAATVYHNIGGILYARGDFATAEGPARKARKISCQLLGEDAPRTMLDATAYAGILERAYGPRAP